MFIDAKLSLDIRLQKNDAVWVEVLQNNPGNYSIPISKDGFKTWFSGHLVMRL
jgi:hypothetical protein